MKKTRQQSCPYCGAPVVFRPASAVYGSKVNQKGSHLYVCSRYPECDAYVGVHRNTSRSMGVPADRQLRQKRIHAHRMLEELRRERRMSKWGVYLWLQTKLDLPPDKAHIGMFTAEMCDRLIDTCRRELQGGYGQTA